MMSLERIASTDGSALAIVIRADFHKNGTNFVSDKNSPFQVGVGCHDAGAKIKAHFHVDRKQEICGIQEVVHLESGRANVDIYSRSGVKIKSVELKMGDTIFFVDGGHGFTMLEPTKFVEVKQGPYLEKRNDKVLLDEAE